MISTKNIVRFTLVFILFISGLKAGSSYGLSKTDLSGTYWLLGSELRLRKRVLFNDGTDDIIAETSSSVMWNGTINFDGKGGCSYSSSGNEIYFNEGSKNIEIHSVGTESDSCTYTLSSDGTLRVDGATGIEVAKVSPDTNFISVHSIEREDDFDAYNDATILIKQSSGLGLGSLPAITSYLLF